MKNEGIQDQDHDQEGGELLLLLGTDDQEADQGGGHIQSQEVGGDLKVQEGGDLIPEREAEGLGAHPKPRIKRRKRRKRNVLKLHQKATAQPDDREAQAEIDGAEEAGVEQGHLKSPGPLKENCLGPHLQEDIKRKRRRIKTKREAEMRESGQRARRKKAKTKRRIGKENPRVTKT